MIPLSIIVMMGATSTPADAAARTSTPRREKRRWVLYLRGEASRRGEREGDAIWRAGGGLGRGEEAHVWFG